MSLSYSVSEINNSNLDVKTYKIEIRQSDSIYPIYTYNRNSIDYGGNNWVPNLFDIYSEADDLLSSDSLGGCGTLALGNMTLSIFNFNIDTSKSVSPNNGDVLGLYLGSEVSESFEYSFLTCATYGTRQKHNFQYGYIDETKYHAYKYLYNDNGNIVDACTYAQDTEHDIFRCDSLILSYTITSLPPPDDDRVETDCCILVCCEPDKYKLI